MLGPQCRCSEGGWGRDPSIVTATPGTLRQVCSGYRTHSWRVTCPHGGGGRGWSTELAGLGPAGLGRDCSGSWRAGRAGTAPSRRRDLIVCPQIRNGGSCFLCLRKCRAQGWCLQDRKSWAQGKGRTGPPFPLGAPPQGPHLLSARPGGTQAGGLAPDPQGPPGQRGDHGFTLLPGQSGARALGALPWFLGCSAAPPNRWAAQLCQEDARPPFHPGLAGGRCEDVGPQAPACGWPAAWPSNPLLMRPDSLHQGRWVPGALRGLRRRAPPPNKRPPVRCLCPIAA